jgi:hypothetical protein
VSKIEEKLAEALACVQKAERLMAKLGMRCRVLRYWDIGSLGCLKARRNRRDGRVEIFAPRSNPDHSLWLETHKDHWHKFEQNIIEHPTEGHHSTKERLSLFINKALAAVEGASNARD